MASTKVKPKNKPSVKIPAPQVSSKDKLFNSKRSVKGVDVSLVEAQKKYSTSVFNTQSLWRNRQSVSYPEMYSTVVGYIKGASMVMLQPQQRKRMRISWDPKESYTDGESIWINTKPLADSNMSVVDRLAVCKGLGVHECLHLLYTDFLAMPRNPMSSMARQLFNVIEDERIERLGADDFPVYAIHLIDAKEYFFYTIENAAPTNDLAAVLQQLFSIIRYPERVDETLVSQLDAKYNNVIENSVGILKPYPDSTETAIKKALQIELLLLNEFPKTDPITGDTTLVDSTIEAIARAIEEAGLMSKHGEPMSDTRKAILVEHLNPSNRQALSEVQDTYVLSNETYKDPSFSLSCNVLWDKKSIKLPTDIMKYKQTVSAHRKEIATLRKLLVSESINTVKQFQGLKTGTLDTSKLVEAVQGVETVYKQRQLYKTTAHKVCLVIDVSGSMAGDKLKRAVQATVIMFEALKNQPDLELYVYAHTAEHTQKGSVSIDVYAEPGFCNAEAVVSLTSKSYNRDGVVLETIGARIRKFTQDHVLLILLADGQPNAPGYKGEYAIRHTKKATSTLEKMNITPIAVSIDSAYNPADVFTHYVPFEGIAKLPKTLATVMLKNIKKYKKIIATNEFR